MSLDYSKINVMVDGNYILVESLSLSQNSEQNPLYSLNNSRPYDNTPQGIKNTIDLTYFIEPESDPCYRVISGWKVNTASGSLLALLQIGEVSFNGHLNNYSFNVLPNQPVKARASFVYFHHTAGNLSEQPFADDGNNYNLQNGTGISHFWSTDLTSGTGFTTINNNDVLQLDYSFRGNILPSYKLGSPFVSQVSVLDATEEINMVNEVQNIPRFSGQDFSTIFNEVDNIRLKNLSSTWGDVVNKIDFSISGYEVQSSKTDMSTENLVIWSHNLKKYY